MTTFLDQLCGRPNVDDLVPPAPQRVPQRSAVHEKEPIYFDAVTVGAGQSGLSVGGRLQALGVSYVVIDEIQNVGDNWTSRYDSTRLHTTREFAHLPFERTFGAQYQEYLTKDDVARGFIQWTKKFNINL